MCSIYFFTINFARIEIETWGWYLLKCFSCSCTDASIDMQHDLIRSLRDLKLT